MSEQKHSWTEEELRIVCICYKENLSVDLALRLTNTTNKKSMIMRYQNCLYLDKGRVENSLSHASKKLIEVWDEVEDLYENVAKQENPKQYVQLTNLEFDNLISETQVNFLIECALMLSMAVCCLLSMYIMYIVS